MLDIESFQVTVPDDALSVLRDRLEAASWPEPAPGQPWQYGTDFAYLRELVTYWIDQFDWAAQEACLNSFTHHRANVDGFGIHFVAEPGVGPAHMPLVLTHGWPGLFYEMLPIARQLADPASFRADPADAFDVVVPSLPGFGFSGQPQDDSYDAGRTAELWHTLLLGLGYERYGAYGSDWGSVVTGHLGARFPDSVVGILRPGTPSQTREATTEAERKHLAMRAKWMVDETGYQRIHGTKPQTLAYGFTDSPIALAAWLVEKLRAWSDCDGDIERRFSKDQQLAFVSLFWHSGCTNSSMRFYLSNGLGNSHGLRAAKDSDIKVPQGSLLCLASRASVMCQTP
jgi:pimeloyl-ACP methyl ester carboxylesterase